MSIDFRKPRVRRTQTLRCSLVLNKRAGRLRGERLSALIFFNFLKKRGSCWRQEGGAGGEERLVSKKAGEREEAGSCAGS